MEKRIGRETANINMTRSVASTEQGEFRSRQELLNQKRAALTEFELSLSTLQANLRCFDLEYHLKVGVLYVKLDELQAILDNLHASKAPLDTSATKRAMDSKGRAEKSARAAEEFRDQKGTEPSKFQPTPELRSLYRELAKRLHPDLTLDPVDKERRHGLMQQINQAYQSGDVDALNRIMDAERNNPENVKGNGDGPALERIAREIAQIEKRIAELDTELQKVRKSDLYILYETIYAEALKGNDVLEQLSTELNSRISCLRDEINHARR